MTTRFTFISLTALAVLSMPVAVLADGSAPLPAPPSSIPAPPPSVDETSSPEPVAVAPVSVAPSAPEPAAQPAMRAAPEAPVAPVAVPPESTTPESTTPESTVPGSTVPGSTVPGSTVPESSVPDSTVPESSVPQSTNPEETVPVSSVETTPSSIESVPSTPPTSNPEEMDGSAKMLPAAPVVAIPERLPTYQDRHRSVPSSTPRVIVHADATWPSAHCVTAEYRDQLLDLAGHVDGEAAIIGQLRVCSDIESQLFGAEEADVWSPDGRDINAVRDLLRDRSRPPVVSSARRPVRNIVFPVLGPVRYANGWNDPRDGGARRHEGTDMIGARMQPLLAAVDGEVVRLAHGRGKAGTVITIRDQAGYRYNYFHVNNDHPGTDDGRSTEWSFAAGIEVGTWVSAGQIIGFMGDSGNAEHSVAHLHFEIRHPNGQAIPSYASLRLAESAQMCTIGLGPWSTPGDGELVADRWLEVSPMWGEGRWLISESGHVVATGDAALISPSRGVRCAAGPTEPYGYGAAGWSPVIGADLVAWVGNHYPTLSAQGAAVIGDRDLDGEVPHWMAMEFTSLHDHVFAVSDRFVSGLEKMVADLAPPTLPEGTKPQPASLIQRR
ncbi:MAG: hypothetical protein CSA55_04265 [Ilumatobacter coccineus]|uniref:M23ase beta-sheet core domain-containing protein n=1 Tax=Ilumatobacter coccineus TaxID=467094 RepID=A0A2G6K8Q0_9ACTN|nr:MAG: hypothetical protein CSA55_04265 [Ilumatobacter coccineus]